MASFANFSASLNLNIQNFSNQLQRASAQMKSFARNISGETVDSMKELNKQTSAWGLNLKSVSRVVSGILISQAFYSMLRSVREASQAVWEFTKQLETAQVAYSNLFGSTSLATEFINVLKDFAAKTPFSFTEAEAAAKRLLAYGIEYKNVMYVMQGVLSAASIQGDATKIESISRALGQIYTYGKLMTQEVRQLSEAGIPAYEILREELGLTQEQLANLGNEGIPASLAINALVDGIQKRFGTAAEAAALTLTGLISNIKDNATMLFSSMFEPLSNFVKAGLAELGKLLFTLRELQETAGTGAVFEYLFPEESQAVLRQFVANFQGLFQSIARLVAALSGLLKPVMSAVLSLFNAFAPIITLVLNVMSELVYMITSNATAMRWLAGALAAAAAMWVVYKVKAFAAAVVTTVITGMSKALAGLSTMLTFVVAHPFWALLIGLTGVLIGATVGFGALGDKVTNFFKKLTQFNGIDPDKVLLPSQKERANDLDKFNDRLDDTSDSMDELADSTGKATKAAKGLLAFDEVFKLNEPDEGTDNGVDVDDLLDDIQIPDNLGGDYMPEVPDFSEYFNGLKSNYIDQLKQAWDELGSVTEAIVSTAIGAAFGRLFGKLLGGKLGGFLGTIAGAIVGYFWNMLADHFGLEPDQKVNAGIIGGVGAVLGAILGGLIGGPLGAKIGAVIGGLVGSFWGIFAEALGVIPEQHIATMVSGAMTGLTLFIRRLLIGLSKGLVATFTNDVFTGFSKMVGFSFKATLKSALKQGAIGAITGLATGILANALTAWIAKEFELTEQDLENSSVGQTIGSIVGSIAGLILGGPIGSIVGGSLGQLAGAVIGEFWAYMGEALQGAIIGGAAGTPIGALVGTLVGSIGGPLGAALGAVVGVAIGGLVGLIVEHWDTIAGFFSGIGQTITDGFTKVADWFTNIGTSISDFVGGVSATLEPLVSNITSFFTSIANEAAALWSAFVESLGGLTMFFSDIFMGVQTVLNDVWTAITTVATDVFNAITIVLNDIWLGITTVFNDIATAVYTVCSTVFETISNIFGLVVDIIVMAVTNMWNAVVTWFSPIAEEIARVVSVAWEVVSTWFGNILNTVNQFVADIWNEIAIGFGNMLNTISDALEDIWVGVSTVFGNLLDEVTGIVRDMWSSVSNWFGEIYIVMRSGVVDAYNAVTGFFEEMYDGVTGSISDMYSSIKDGIANMYNSFTGFISNLWDNVFGKFFDWINSGIDKLREFFGLNEDVSNANFSSPSYSSGTTYGHATGGVFNREHIARLNEGNKTEAVIPLEEATAMQPFVTAVADGLTASLAPLLANIGGGNNSQLQPLYVGTLIADERSLKELQRKMQVIQLQEDTRRGR